MDEFLIAPGYVSWLDPGLSIFKTEFDSAHYNSRLMAEIGPAYGALIDKAIVKRKSEFIAGRYCAHRSIAAWNPTSDLIGIGKGSMPLWPSKGHLEQPRFCRLRCSVRRQAPLAPAGRRGAK
ncbi:hypothetical protein, partial [Xanthomonas arboricola]|uniref:hypothetical protein n=1 Tax=Xanthomonas arboricola TaxID=56448 RepID=UPI001CA55FE0